MSRTRPTAPSMMLKVVRISSRSSKDRRRSVASDALTPAFDLGYCWASRWLIVLRRAFAWATVTPARKRTIPFTQLLPRPPGRSTRRGRDERDALKYAGVSRPIDERGWVDVELPAVRGTEMLDNQREAVRLRERQGTVEQGVDDREDGGIGADADREREDGDGREAG